MRYEKRTRVPWLGKSVGKRFYLYDSFECERLFVFVKVYRKVTQVPRADSSLRASCCFPKFPHSSLAVVEESKEIGGRIPYCTVPGIEISCLFYVFPYSRDRSICSI